MGLLIVVLSSCRSGPHCDAGPHSKRVVSGTAAPITVVAEGRLLVDFDAQLWTGDPGAFPGVPLGTGVKGTIVRVSPDEAVFRAPGMAEVKLHPTALGCQ